MGLLDFMAEVYQVSSNMRDLKGVDYDVSCTHAELFEISTVWKGTARMYGAGNHIQTIPANYSTTINVPTEKGIVQRDDLRKSMKQWLSKTFFAGNVIPRGCIVLNEAENCLSCEGFAKDNAGKWLVTNSAASATRFISFKIFLSLNGNEIDHDELYRLFYENNKIGVGVNDVEIIYPSRTGLW